LKYHAITQEEQSKLKIQKTRQLHDMICQLNYLNGTL